jgi:hypothetical protein
LAAHGQERTRIVFDTNFRARGWAPDLDIARRVFGQAFETADIALASTEDLLPLWPGESNEALLARIGSAEAVLKLAEPKCIVRAEGSTQEVAAEPLTNPVVDTTAAGDSFAAAYVAARLNGADSVEAALAGHRLAGVVVCYPGAIIPRSAMPADGGPHLAQGCKMTAVPKQQQLAALFKQAVVIPVLTIEKVEHAVPLAKALVAGGVRTLEVTLRTDAAIAAAKAIIAEVPDAIVGIGTIPQPGRPRARQGARRQVRHQPWTHAGAAECGGRQRSALRAGHRHRLRTDAGAGRRLRLRSNSFRPSRPAVSRHCARSPAHFPHVRVCPTGGHWRGQRSHLACRAQRALRRRVLALPARRYPHRQLGRHNRHVRSGHEFAESGVKSARR